MAPPALGDAPVDRWSSYANNSISPLLKRRQRPRYAFGSFIRLNAKAFVRRMQRQSELRKSRKTACALCIQTEPWRGPKQPLLSLDDMPITTLEVAGWYQGANTLKLFLIFPTTLLFYRVSIHSRRYVLGDLNTSRHVISAMP